METQCAKSAQTASPKGKRMNHWVALTSRGLLRICGEHARVFLHGLVTQDLMQGMGPWFGALLSPHGRFLADFFIFMDGDDLLLDVAKDHHSVILSTLGPLAAFHDVRIEEELGRWAVCGALGPQIHHLLQVSSSFNGHDIFLYADPRTPSMGLRAVVPYGQLVNLPHPLLLAQSESFYHRHRWMHGVAEGAYDLVAHKSIILEYGYHTYGALSWDKGCYMGQELMARSYHLGEIRKKPYAIWSDRALPEKGSALWKGDARVGIMGGSAYDEGRWIGLVVLDSALTEDTDRLDLHINEADCHEIPFWRIESSCGATPHP